MNVQTVIFTWKIKVKGGSGPDTKSDAMIVTADQDLKLTDAILTASLLPARRATMVDPVESLRVE